MFWNIQTNKPTTVGSSLAPKEQAQSSYNGPPILGSADARFEAVQKHEEEQELKVFGCEAFLFLFGWKGILWSFAGGWGNGFCGALGLHVLWQIWR